MIRALAVVEVVVVELHEVLAISLAHLHSRHE